MIAVAMRFPAGRYHATGWDHQVNEGTVEWPPSPWRFLRVLVAAWHRQPEFCSEQQLAELLTQFAGTIPSYSVPAFGTGHTRHYMPTDGNTTKVFDTFVAPGSAPGAADGELVMVWPDLELPLQSQALLARLLGSITYLGRAESWVDMQLVWPDDPPRCNVVPMQHSDNAARETVRLMVPLPTHKLHEWSSHFRRLNPKSKITVPNSLLEVLRQNTGELQKQKWSAPPGVEWIDYRVERTRAVRKPSRPMRPEQPTTALFELSGAVLPPIEHSVRINDRLRRSLMSRSDAHWVFAGKDESSKPLEGRGHSYFLSFSATGSGTIDRILVHAEAGFDEQALRALTSLHSLWGAQGHDIHTGLVGIWTPTQIRSMAAHDRPVLLQRANVWISATPFVLHRFPKTYRDGRPKLDANGQWIDGPESQLRSLLARQNLPDPTHIEAIDYAAVQGLRIPWYRFDRDRNNGRPGPLDSRGHGFILTFPEAISGPLVLGRDCHFGLGLFKPLDTKEWP